VSDKPTTNDSAEYPTATLSELPQDELLRYGREFGLVLDPALGGEEIVRRIRLHRELLVGLDREAMLDIVAWGRRPVRRSAGREHLAREIAKIQRTKYEDLSTRGLLALTRLRGLPANSTDGAEKLIDILRTGDGIWRRIADKRRRWIGSLLTRVIEGKQEESSDEYRFLPEDGPHNFEPVKSSLKSQFETHGIVGGIANRLRGAADDYIQIKLDEIEARIDAKLDQIDARLSEWRDREVANRLRILRITLVFTVLVALLSLGYNYAKQNVEQSGQATSQAGEPVVP